MARAIARVISLKLFTEVGENTEMLMSWRPPCKQCNCDDCDKSNHLLGEHSQSVKVSALLANTTTQAPSSAVDSSATPPVLNAPPTGVDKGMRMAQLNDDILGQIIIERWSQTNCRMILGMSHEVRQLYQQWEQLLVQDGLLCRKVEDQKAKSFQLQLRNYSTGGTCGNIKWSLRRQ